MPTKFAAQVRTASGVVVNVYADTVSQLNTHVNNLSYSYPLANSSSAIANKETKGRRGNSRMLSMVDTPQTANLGANLPSNRHTTEHLTPDDGGN